MPFETVAVNYTAVLGAAVASIALGSLWYGPLLGKQWMKYAGLKKSAKMTPAIKNMMVKSYVLTFIGSAVTAYVIAHFINYLAIATWMDAFTFAFWAWLGFVAMRSMGAVLWEGKPWGFYFLNVAYDLVNLAIITTILTLWV